MKIFLKRYSQDRRMYKLFHFLTDKIFKSLKVLTNFLILKMRSFSNNLLDFKKM